MTPDDLRRLILARVPEASDADLDALNPSAPAAPDGFVSVEALEMVLDVIDSLEARIDAFEAALDAPKNTSVLLKGRTGGALDARGAPNPPNRRF